MMRFACIAYLVMLTALLLTADPLRLIGVRGAGPSMLKSLMPAAHVLSFGLLAMLALSPRWPAPRWIIVLLLAVYGAMTEVAQSFLPPRTAEWADWLQDVAGIAVAAGACWLVALAAGMRARLVLQTQACRQTSQLPESNNGRRESWWG